MHRNIWYSIDYTANILYNKSKQSHDKPESGVSRISSSDVLRRSSERLFRDSWFPIRASVTKRFLFLIFSFSKATSIREV